MVIVSVNVEKLFFRIYAKQDAPQHSSKAVLTLRSAFTVFLGKAEGFSMTIV